MNKHKLSDVLHGAAHGVRKIQVTRNTNQENEDYSLVKVCDVTIGTEVVLPDEKEAIADDKKDTGMWFKTKTGFTYLLNETVVFVK